jgi:hypothetical protein
MRLSGDKARLILGCVRLTNGALALLAPRTLLRRLGSTAPDDAAAIHALRMFGIRTIVIGLELLLLSDGPQRRQATRVAVLIHASDTLSAASLGLRRQLPLPAAATATLISAANTALAIAAAIDRDSDQD